MSGGILTHILLAALACLLLVAVYTDLRGRVIEHWTNAAVALLAPIWWWANGYALWPDVAIQIGIALAVFAVFAGVYAIGQMGGGDVKLLGALALWLPAMSLFDMLFIMALAGGLLSVVVLIAQKRLKSKKIIEVPYGVAIAAGGLWVIGEPYLNHFA
jgi:prepilin peptidase CpaA